MGKKDPRRALLIWICVLAALLAVLIPVAVSLPDGTEPVREQTVMTAPETEPTQTQVPQTEATQPPVTLDSTVTLAATGDVLMHMPVIRAAAVGGEYDFSPMFTYLSDYVAAADLAVANLETTLAGTENGYSYSGYPAFNCPDSIAAGLRDAGFDLLLTANNHSYDTRGTGLRRTPQVVMDAGLSYLGSKEQAEEPNYLVLERNGIRLGLCCYTYENDADPEGKAPNGITMAEADRGLLNTFDYENLPLFYEEMAENIRQMRAAGADAVVLFIHWGNEYQIQQNETQSVMAQALCDLGVDVIIGGHPHVVQPLELLTATDDPAHRTVCLYSMGNAVSNQRVSEMNLKTGHTEDGVLFQVTFTRYSDGTVILSGADVLPTWVDLRSSPKKTYVILPLDDQVEDWQAQFDLTDAALKQARASYERTLEITGAGLEEINAYLEERKAQTERNLGVVTP